ncbi:hypothetical protein [Vitiosangium sp. GDMCC 1.1324]|uniref:hypothetical protein n=1 Tax=Vitiosangium sp. (strain GDMCC 1.1324) TaxID=2138576 RepID=UPI000D3C98BC|nr:hypothetical protein [Vitiosangium sp. GDMCC 1.1324]PTL77201.1 hypothetical protein DAT35_44995 [Vitiosangium sp. GDMCC 1.1324]
MIVRLVAIGFALLLSMQAALPGGTITVCRFTGKRVEPCACPEKKPVEQRVLPQGCCEIQQGHRADFTGVVPSLDWRPQFHAVEFPAVASWTPPEPPEEPGLRVRSGHDPPPRERLFLSLRQLLI